MSHRSVAPVLRDSQGAVLIEFAFVLPLLLMIIVGIFDFGFAFQEYAVVTNAAREGARMAVLPGYSNTDVEDRVAAYLIAGGVKSHPTTKVEDDVITPDGAQPFTVKKVTVTIGHTFSMLAPFAKVLASSGATATLEAVSIMRTEVVAGGN